MRKTEAIYNFFKSGCSLCYRGIFSGSANGKMSAALIYFQTFRDTIPFIQKTNCLHLKQWKVTNEYKSLIQILYAEKPKNPV
jgi:hypothetical protein